MPSRTPWRDQPTAGEQPARRKLSVVVPVLNEERGLRPLIERLQARARGPRPRLGGHLRRRRLDRRHACRSSSASTRADRRIKAVSLSRNFGKEIATAAGLSYATGDAAVLMDADLQHPPELIEEFVERWREGYDIVYGQRRDRDADTLAAPLVRARLLRRPSRS